MKNGSRKFIFLVVYLISHFVIGQNDFFFSHYMFNPSYFNPALVGVEDQAFLVAHHRTQWAGYAPTFDPGAAPTTQLVSLIIPAKGKIMGFGLTAVNDTQFGLRSNQVRFQISFKKEFRSGFLSLGLAPSINLQTLDPGDFRPSDPSEDFGTKQSQLKPNIHAGLFYQSNSRYAIGVSVENIIEPSFTLNGFDQLDYFNRNLNLYVLREFGLTRDLIVRPSVLARSSIKNISGYSYDISIIAEYQNKIWGGLAFRRSESLGVLLGYSFLEGGKLKAGYSFDYTIKEQDAKEPTSHEVYLRYNLPDLILGGRKAVKTPRFSF